MGEDMPSSRKIETIEQEGECYAINQISEAAFSDEEQDDPVSRRDLFTSAQVHLQPRIRTIMICSFSGVVPCRENHRWLTMSHELLQHVKDRVLYWDCISRLRQHVPTYLLDSNIQAFVHTSLGPPITKATLSELDVSKIINKPRMRHDLNFDPNYKFEPDYKNPEGDLKRRQSKEYWSALSIELALYMECALRPSHECLLHSLSSSGWPLRLPQLFSVLHDILRTIIRDEEWPSIDETLDVDLLMQQLRKGICDLTSLSNWLGRVLKGSCSPLRDGRVDEVVEILNTAVAGSDPSKLSEGLANLFSLLETMKLVCAQSISKRFCSADPLQDIANHQIRFLRLLMINDSTQYISEHFRQRMHSGVGREKASFRSEADSARTWYDEATRRATRELSHRDSEFDEGEYTSEKSGYVLFGMAVRDLVRQPIEHGNVHGHDWMPISFEYDYKRLSNRRHQYRQMLLDRQLVHVLNEELKANGLRGAVPPYAQEALKFRIRQLMDTEFGSTDAQTINWLFEISVEIVRAVYELLALPGVPSWEYLSVVHSRLSDATNPRHPAFTKIERSLSDDLTKFLEEEIVLIHDLEPLQIVNHYQPPYPPSTGLVRSAETVKLQQLAGSIAQISVLHWRVWASILYLPSLDDVFADNEASSHPQTGQQSAASADEGSPVQLGMEPSGDGGDSREMVEPREETPANAVENEALHTST